MKRKKKTVEDLREYIVKHIKWHNAKANEWKIDGWFYITFANHKFSEYDGEGAHFMAHPFLKQAIQYIENDLPLHFITLDGKVKDLQLLVIVCHLDIENEHLEFREVVHGLLENNTVYHSLF
jgi:hypothetical protein